MADASKFRVKNRAPAPIQITAEQILREAKDRQIEVDVKVPKQQLTDAEELRLFRTRKRKEFEDGIRRQRQHIGTWMKYAAWEESQKEIERSRSIYERALDVDFKSQSLWLRYAEMEMRNKFVNHARNIWDRAVTLLPRVDQFWYKYAYMEEMLGEADKARCVFERWMEWEPDDNAWTAFVKFEMRRQQPQRARAVLERYATSRPSARSFLKWAKWEEQQGQLALARAVYERAVAELPEGEGRGERLLVAFAEFEERCKEDDRARVIYKYALDQGTREQMPELHRAFVAFEKRHGGVGDIEEAVVAKRRLQYEEEVAADPHDYDAWFDYIRLEESGADLGRIREVYERAIANVPPVAEKRFWRRYVLLWVGYAVFEELQAGDVHRAKAVYSACLRVIPHETFTFGKMWLLLAKLHVREKDLAAARKTLGTAIGRCPKPNIFKGYIELEAQLGEADRVRKVYAKYLETFPYNCSAWIDFAHLEQTYGENERARSLFELSISQPLENPDRAWKAYIDFETGLEETQRARDLYERLLDLSEHQKVWVSYARFEASAKGAGGIAAARVVLKRAYDGMRQHGLKEPRVALLEEWRTLEREAGRAGKVGDVEKMMPRRFKKKRMMVGEGGEELGWEEYYDYRFPDDEEAPANLRILEMAQKWKMKQQEEQEQQQDLGHQQEPEPQHAEEEEEQEVESVAAAAKAAAGSDEVGEGGNGGGDGTDSKDEVEEIDGGDKAAAKRKAEEQGAGGGRAKRAAAASIDADDKGENDEEATAASKRKAEDHGENGAAGRGKRVAAAAVESVGSGVAPDGSGGERDES